MARTPFKAPVDPRGGHIRIYWDTFDSVAWSCLSASAQLAYMALMRQKGKTNNGDLSLPITFAKRYGIGSETTLAKALRELLALGFIAVTRKGGSQRDGQRLATLYRFTDIEVYAVPAKCIEASKPTNDWRAITSVEIARQKLDAAELAARQESIERKTKSALQKLGSTTPANGVVRQKTTPEIGVWPQPPPQKMECGNEAKNGRKPMPARVSA